ncbi:MAG: VWA domain-containing protein [Lachnospiraceae bacterium]|nr:VWA domain-containing protein [Lachnospiraceae bacterium]
MKKKIVVSLLVGAIVTASLAGCSSAATSSHTERAEPEAVCIDPSYPEELPEYESAADDEGSYYAESCEEESCAAGSAVNESICFDNSFAASESASYKADAQERLCGPVTDMFCPGYICPKPDPNRGENYRSVAENPFTDVASSPLSTFGADIDTASYSNLRRMITDGYTLSQIPAGSVRTEELVNYFDYDYKSPKNGDAFAVNASIIDCPWNRETKLVTLGIKAKEIGEVEDIPSNIVFLVDVSGSMNDYDKLPLLQMGFDMLIDDLDEDDRVSIVTYASDSDIVIAGVPGNEHTALKKAVNSLKASGSTNGGEGIRTAYKLAEKYFIKGGNNRVIMATDGDLNVGITSEDELEELISDKKEGGVFLSVLGFGTGNYNEATLETLADKGNGNYSYIDCLAQAKKVLVDEFNSTLFTVAKDVKFQTEFNPGYVKEYRLVGYENRQMASRDFNDDSKDGGEIGSGHAMTVMYEIKMNDSDEKDDGISLRYQDNRLSDDGLRSGEWMTVSVRYKEPEADESKLIYFPVSSGCYTKNPNRDTLFAAYVAECGMIINDSEYTGNLDMRDVSKQVSRLDLNDEYKEEFLDLIRQL